MSGRDHPELQFSRVSPEVAIKQIRVFERRFGLAHLQFAYHAALPLSLTPDLLYKLWANFNRDIDGTYLQILWIAVADLLLSNLCRLVGHELYEMDPAIRRELLLELERDPRFGPKRIEDLAEFLLEYIKLPQFKSDDPYTRDFAQVQEWTALAYTQPEQSARKLAQAFAENQNETTEHVRLASVVETLTQPDAEFTKLLYYARGMASLAYGEQEAAVTRFSKVYESGQQKIVVAGVGLVIPLEIIRELVTRSGSQGHAGRVTIREKGYSDEGWQVEISFDNGPIYSATVKNPFDQEQEKQLEWYFEVFSEFPFKEKKRKKVARSVTTYGENLFEQLFGHDRYLFAEYKKRSYDLQFEISGSPDFHALHWETLKDPNRDLPFVVEGSFVRKNDDPISSEAKLRHSPTLNILIVSARPRDFDDIPYRAISAPIINALHNSQLPIHIDLVRPGTYEQLHEQLETTYDKHRSGYYHIIHFDVHGKLLTYEALQRGYQDKKYLHDSYGRTLPSKYKGQKGFLFFEGEQNQQSHPVMADQIGKLLQRHSIPIVILNACQSAKQLGGTAVDTSLGSRLMGAGTQLVVAMAYSVTASAAKLLTEVLYKKLFEAEPLLTAIRRARLKLYTRKNRIARYSQTIALEDWLLPIVYQYRPIDLHLTDFPNSIAKREYWKKESECYAADLQDDFVGRDLDILRIEKQLLTSQKNNILLVSGKRGVGKTALLQHLAEWWHRTNLVTYVFYFSYGDKKTSICEQIIAIVAEKVFGEAEYHGFFKKNDLNTQKTQLAKELRAQRHLLILDQLELITEAAERDALRDFLSVLAKGKTLVLLGSQDDEKWLMGGKKAPLRKTDVYELSGLDTEATSILAEQILEEHYVAHYQSDNAFGRLLELLDGNPLALVEQLEKLADQSPAEILAALQGEDDQTYLKANQRLRDLGFQYNPFNWLQAERVPEEILDDLFQGHPGFEEHIKDLNSSTALLAPRGGGKTANRLYLAKNLNERREQNLKYEERKESPPHTPLVVTYVDFQNVVKPGSKVLLKDHEEPLLTAIAKAACNFMTKHPSNFMKLDPSKRERWWSFLKMYWGFALHWRLKNDLAQDLRSAKVEYPPFSPNDPTATKLKEVREMCSDIGIDRLFILVDQVDNDDKKAEEWPSVLDPLLNTQQLFESVVWKFFLPNTQELVDFVTNSQTYQTLRLKRVDIIWDEDSLRALLELRLSWASDGAYEFIDQLCDTELLNTVNVEKELIQMALRQTKIGPPRALLYQADKLFSVHKEEMANMQISSTDWNRFKEEIAKDPIFSKR